MCLFFCKRLAYHLPRLKMKLDVYYEVVYTVVYDNEFSLQKPLQLAFKMTLSIYNVVVVYSPALSIQFGHVVNRKRDRKNSTQFLY